jgi:uncharacterized protein YndB with AHSA1/START domain
MPKYNWNEFTRRIPIQAPAKSVYDAWTTQQGLESWFLRLAQFKKPNGELRPRNDRIEAGDHYKWLWHGYTDSTAEESNIISINGWDQLSFGFSGGCVVSVTIAQEEGETICELNQQIPMDDADEKQYFFIECGNGWGFYMTNLKSVLESGHDLRNRNVNIQRVITA